MVFGGSREINSNSGGLGIPSKSCIFPRRAERARDFQAFHREIKEKSWESCETQKTFLCLERFFMSRHKKAFHMCCFG